MLCFDADWRLDGQFEDFRPEFLADIPNHTNIQPSLDSPVTLFSRPRLIRCERS